MSIVKITYSFRIIAKWIVLSFLFITFFYGCNNSVKSNEKVIKIDHPIVGKWIKTGHAGSFSFHFKENGFVEGDFGNDQSIDVVAAYEIQNDTIKFTDKKGQMCAGFGKYKMYQTDYYVAFDLIDDECGGRIKTTMGFWVKADFKESLTLLDEEISNSQKQESFLNRARIYLAIGKSKLAKQDFDSFILNDTTNARVYINRAGTRFPNDLKGVLTDCNKAIALDPKNKNAYFLKGLAGYDLGYQEQACKDFEKAIELGFSILKIAEKEKCSMFWNNIE